MLKKAKVRELPRLLICCHFSINTSNCLNCEQFLLCAKISHQPRLDQLARLGKLTGERGWVRIMII